MGNDEKRISCILLLMLFCRLICISSCSLESPFDVLTSVKCLNARVSNFSQLLVSV